MFIASTKTGSRSSGATTQSNAVKVRNGAERTSPETYRHAGHKTSTFSFRKEWSYFCFSFELLQDGAPQTLKCPLCPEGVSLSAAKSDRQSGALKAHTPFSPQRLRSQTPGPGSVRHTPTRTLPGRVCSVQRARVTPPSEATANDELTCAPRRKIVRKSLARKKKNKKQKQEKTQLSAKQSFPVQATPTRLNQPLFLALICGSVSVLIR